MQLSAENEMRNGKLTRVRRERRNTTKDVRECEGRRARASEVNGVYIRGVTRILEREWALNKFARELIANGTVQHWASKGEL